MAELVRFPKLGTNIVEGAVGLWRRKEGDRVGAGEPLVEIITSKATFDVESPAAGVLLEILAPEKSTAPVGFILGIVGEPEETLPDVTPENNRLLAEFRAAAHAPAASQKAAAGSPSRGGATAVRATPGARRVAKEAGVDLGDVASSSGGKPAIRLAGKVITEGDVRQFLSSKREL